MTARIDYDVYRGTTDPNFALGDYAWRRAAGARKA
jgi:hypothetical protein